MGRMQQIMDEFYRIVNGNPPEEGVDKLIRAAEHYRTQEFGSADSIEALARLLTICHLRRKYLESGIVVEGFKE